MRIIKAIIYSLIILCYIAIGLLLWPSSANAQCLDTFWYAEAEQAWQIDTGEDTWIGDYPFTLRVGWHNDLNPNVYFRGGLTHISNLDRGDNWLWRANYEPESRLDTVNILLGYRW